MFRLTAERPDPWTEGGASTDHQSAKDIGVRDSSTKTAQFNVRASRTRPRRWNRKPRFTPSDAAAWALVTLVVGTTLIAACVVLTLGWPS
jgi:hypothetical protein